MRAIDNYYARELALTETQEETIPLGGGITAILTSEPPTGVLRTHLHFLSDLLEQYRPAIEAVERAKDAEDWRCPDCGEPLSAHKANWNDYGFQWDQPLEDDNEPLLMWDAWQPEFHIAGNWTPTGGFTQ